MSDNVNQPAHYNAGEVETIDAIWSARPTSDYCVCNAIKYLSRAGKKGPELEDIEKAHWYLSFVLAKMAPDKHPDPRTSKAEPKDDIGDRARVTRSFCVDTAPVGEGFDMAMRVLAPWKPRYCGFSPKTLTLSVSPSESDDYLRARVTDLGFVLEQ